MAKYRIVNRQFGFGPGYVLRPTPEQANPRQHNLEPVRPPEGREHEFNGEFVVMKPIEFKAGEVVEIVRGEVGKGALVDRLEELDDDGEPILALDGTRQEPLALAHAARQRQAERQAERKTGARRH